MFLFRKKSRGLVSEVDDSRRIVYDFRTRTNELFGSYRAISYKKPEGYNLQELMNKDAEKTEKLRTSNAIDAGNEDWLVEMILGPVKDGFRYLDDQALEHLDFYNRQGDNMAVHRSDIERIHVLWKEKQEDMANEYAYTKILWNRYRGFVEQEVVKDER